ncbi:haloacid dehalogenase type II [Pseudalkalibacillus caeni]|uniref:Haloacid dehalogenase type II n=1 Tax=Exobacillus caeni TaxID=2574798 RepID=A0A5R9F1U7_9BACL|nr:haloacid dehalogenase type II [Pseudalkalibacillus caeni]TLS37011.1 haloacid dehalogenase type II [Pseudalkalibacillus caeni]
MGDSIKTYVFDVYGTLFDVHSVKELCEELYPEKGESISFTWREKQLEYSFLRQIMGKYTTFLEITKDALRYAVKKQDRTLTSENEEKLIEAYLHLTPYPEVRDVLERLKAGNKLAVFSNGSHDMLDPLIERAGLAELFDHIISIDEAKQYKPSPAAYNLVLENLNVRREEVLFMSSNGWDISGAKSFGFQTAWINRGNQPTEELNLKPDHIFTNLSGV